MMQGLKAHEIADAYAAQTVWMGGQGGDEVEIDEEHEAWIEAVMAEGPTAE